MSSSPIIGITTGDPAGIGPEVCLKACASARLSGCSLILLGDEKVMRSVSTVIGSAMPPVAYSLPEALRMVHGGISRVVYHIDAIERGQIVAGQVSAMSGKASYRWINEAIDAALAKEIDAIATGPIHKESLRAAGVLFPGHTEIFAARTQSQRACMMLTSPELTCSFVTTHVGYRDVPSLLSIDRIVDVIELSNEAMRRLHCREVKLAICGLNPHAGESGLFGGGEEEAFIIPAVKMASQRGIQIMGPLPPDTAFLPSVRRTTDCVVCIYHDQGHIPLKTLAFDKAVNTTLGLPIIRTSVDHGTAFDIAWQGLADESSMIEAILLARKLIGNAMSTRDTTSRTLSPVSVTGGSA